MKIDGEKVRALRERKAWSQEHLATASGLSVRTVQRVERDSSGLPETRLALAAALAVSAAELMGDIPAREAVQEKPGSVPGLKWGWIGWAVGITGSVAGILHGYLNGGSLPDATRALGVVASFAGITAGVMGVLNERFKRRHDTV